MTELLRRAYRAMVPEPVRARLSGARERAGLRLNYRLMRLLPWVRARPHALYIEGTNICNAACVFCAYPQMERPKASMPLELFRRAVDQYLALGPGDVDLTPIVGDPFVDKLLFERMDYLRSRPEVKRYHFYTNAILMKPDIVSRLVGHDDRLAIFCSFGGFDRRTYHEIMGVDKFEAAVANIRNLIDEKVRAGSRIRVQVNLRVPLGSEKGEFWEYLRRRAAEGVIRVDGVADFDNWGGKIGDERLRGAGLVPKPPPIHRGPCRRLLTGPMILADGRVNACCCRDVEATLIIGDVKEKPLGEILAGPALRGLLERHARGDFPEICKTCTRYETL